MNVAMLGSSSIAGLIIARQLGPTGRGEYAAVVAWLGVTLVAGELGQPSALCFYVASDVDRASDYAATARRFLAGSGLIVGFLGWVVAPILGRHDPSLTMTYRLMFASCIVSFVSASFTFPLQAMTITLWNVARLVQPLLYLVAIVVLAASARLTVFLAIVALVATITIQALVAWALCWRVNLHAGSFDAQLARPLLRYGSSQIAANAPTVVNARLDQVILAGYAPYEALGLYAVAVSITSLALPVVSAIGSVVFPRIAEQGPAPTLGLERRAIRASLLLATGMMVAVALLAPWLLPAVFGRAYSQAVPMVWVLSIGGVFLASGQVMGDVLRGRGQPFAVAIAQGVGAIFTVVLLVILLPLLGALGAAVASTAAYFAAFAVSVLALRRPRRQGVGVTVTSLPPARREEGI